VYVDIGSIDTQCKVIVNPKRLESESAPSRAKQNIRKDDVLVSMTRPNLNAVALVPEELDGAVASTGFQVLRTAQLEPRWLYYFTQTDTFVRTMSARVQGVLYPAIRPSDIFNHALPLAPLSEQRRIVAEIESLLSDLDAGVRSLNANNERLRVLRSAVLNSVFSCSRYTLAPLSKLIASGPKNGLYKPADCYGLGVPIVRIDDFQDEFLRQVDQLRKLKIDAAEFVSYGLREGDLLINRVNSMSHLGKCLVVPPHLCSAVFESNIMRISLTSDVDPRWVALFLQSPVGRGRLIKNAKQAVNQASINQADVGSTLIPLPCRAEQVDRVSELDRQLTANRQLRQDILLALTRAARLRRSILKQAFEGNLVAQNPSDEPASVLLERIRSERQPNKPPQKRLKRNPGQLSLSH
jgi:type I restriction enzyme, S subunit